MQEKTKDYEDQAEELRKLLTEVENPQKENNSEREEQDQDEKTADKGRELESGREVDILNLPPRKEVHGEKNKRTRLKISRASLRLITVIVLFILFIGTAYYFWGQELIDIIEGL